METAICGWWVNSGGVVGLAVGVGGYGRRSEDGEFLTVRSAWFVAVMVVEESV